MTQMRLSVEGSATAPVLYVDHIGSVGLSEGVATIALEAKRYMLVVDGERADDRIVIAHLRIPLATLAVLQEAASQIRQMARDQARNMSTIDPPIAAAEAA